MNCNMEEGDMIKDMPAGKKAKPLTKKERKEQKKKRKHKHISYE